MAKWGEGDPRWIVEERPDATNVNNWHWTEKNADAWSKAKIKELFTNHVIENPKIGNVIIEEVEKCDGEARANNRKGKLIFFYEWEITLKWKGHVNGVDVEVTGKIEIPNLSEEHDDMKDVDVDVSVTTPGTEASALKEMLRKGEGAGELRRLLEAYVSALKTEYSSSGLILPKKGQEASSTSAKTTSKTKTVSVTKVNTSSGRVKNSEEGISKMDLGCKLDLAEVKMEENMKCTGQELYNALTQRDMIQIFTGGEAKMDEAAKVGGSFELLGGNISGTFTEVIPFTKIVQTWRLRSWPSGVHSTVTITIKQTKEDTKVSIVQTGVPKKEVDSTREGWQRYYFHAMKRSFGFGASLF